MYLSFLAGTLFNNMKLSKLLFTEAYQPKFQISYRYAKKGEETHTNNLDEVLNYFASENSEYYPITAAVAHFIKNDLVRVLYQFGLQKKMDSLELVLAGKGSRSFAIRGLFTYKDSNGKEKHTYLDDFTILYASSPGNEFIKELQKVISEVSQEEIRNLIEKQLRIDEENPTEEAKENFLLRMQKHFQDWFAKNLKNTGVKVPAGGVARDFTKDNFEIKFISDVTGNPMVISVDYKENEEEKPKHLGFKYYTDLNKEIRFVFEMESDDSYYPEAELDILYSLKKSIDPLSLQFYGGIQGANKIVDNSIRAALNKLKQIIHKKNSTKASLNKLKQVNQELTKLKSF